MTGPESLHLDDGTTIRFLLTEPAQDPVGGAGAPDRLGPVVPVGRRREAIASVASNALRGTLRPLGPLVQEVHDALRSVPSPPSEISVTFGVQLGQDLKLGIVNGNGQAHLTVTATWNPPTPSEPAAATLQPHTDGPMPGTP
ncbi:CU044_2847 family protein [Streptomyces sp. NPDC057592]|uniref:CU044_2847 family protein n=1 Tax=unclassified Streptomyces TaxID=2593676 RepID=UPI0036CE326D